MQIKSTFIQDLENFVSERLSDIECNDFYRSFTDAQKNDFFKFESDCYLRGFVDGVNIAGGLTWI